MTGRTENESVHNLPQREPLEPGVGEGELGGTGKVSGGDPVADRAIPDAPAKPDQPGRQDIHIDYAPGPGKRESPIRQGPSGA